MSNVKSLNIEALTAARAAKLAGLSQLDIAKAVGASQSQVSRILAGKSRRRSKLFTDICIFALNTPGVASNNGRPNVSTNDDLMAAINAVWDGTHQHAKALAIVIHSLGALGTAAPAGASSRANSRTAASNRSP